jgi:hypothetical protein
MTYVGSHLARLAFASLLLIGCSDDSSNPGGGSGNNSAGDDGGAQDGGSQADTPIELARPCTDKAADLYAAPGKLPDDRGEILRCVDDGFISKAQVQKRLDALKNASTVYAGNPAGGGVHVYRVLYKTERGNGAAGSAVASVFLPEKPRADKLPLLLMARGSRGQAAACAPSLLLDPKERDKEVDVVTTDNLDGREVNPDFDALLWPVIADGFIVIATDSAGYAGYGSEGNPPSGYAHVDDMAKSFLDSGFALQKLVPDATTDDVALLGLSQGGHTVLGSLEVANDYPAPGPIKGAAVYAPLWFPQRAWGLVMHPSLAPFYKLEAASASGPIAVWYHYTHAEILDGPGEGKKLFKPEFQDQIEDFVDKTCWSADYAKLLDTGVETIRELFDPAFADAASTGALAQSCDQATDQALCQKWLDRYRRDRPVLSGAATQIPLLVTWGEKDTAIGPGFLQCGVDALEKSGNPIEFCVDPKPQHAGVVLAQSRYVNEWIAAKTLGTEIEATCPKMELPDLGGCQPPQLQE